MVDVPPVYVVAPAGLVYGDLPRAVALTGLRVWGLGWRYQYKRTGRVPLEFLLQVCKVSRSQLYQHLGRLVATGVLRYSSTGGEFTFWFNTEERFTFARAGPFSPENRTGIVVVDFSLSEGVCTDSERGEEQQQQSYLLGGECEGGGGQSGKPDGKAGEFLDSFGILEPTRGELLGLDWVTAEYLEEWWEWWQLEGDEELGPGWFVVQFRQAAEAPKLKGEEMWW